MSNVPFCGIQTRSQKSGDVNWRDSYKWSKSYAEIKDIAHQYLIMLFNLRAQTDRTLHDWSNPPLPDDNRRVCVEVSGLEEIDCLTPAIRTALFNLLASESDVMQLQEENAEYMVWV
jgi:hypothetical protein